MIFIGGGVAPTPPPLWVEMDGDGDAHTRRQKQSVAEKKKRLAAAKPIHHAWAGKSPPIFDVAAFLLPKNCGAPDSRNGAMIPTTAHIWQALAQRTVYDLLIRRAQEIAGEASAFDWPVFRSSPM